MRYKCVRCVATSAPLPQFVMSVRSTIVANALTPTLAGIYRLLITFWVTFCVVQFSCSGLCNVLCREGVRSNAVTCRVRTNLGLGSRFLTQR